MRIQDRSAVLKGGEVKKVYNDVASPDNKVVHTGLDNRHAMLCSMFPMLTPRAERVIDHMMSLSDDEFRVLCHHEGTTVVLNHAKLDMIADALDKTRGPVKLVEYDDFDPDADEVEDEALVAALLAS